MRRMLAIAAVGLTVAALGEPAQATFPGGNGKIVYWQLNNGKIALVNPNGTGKAGIGSGATPKWSADGSEIVVSNNRLTKIYTMNAGGSNRQVVIESSTLGSGWSVSDPSFSPAGQVAFCGFHSTRSGDVEKIFTIGAHGAGLTDISGTHTADCSPDWSPDGTSIAFDITRHYGYRDEIATMSATGTNRTVIASSKRGNDYPSWSPDSSTILFDRIRHGRFDLATVPAAGGQITWLTDTPKRWEFGAVWSPNENKVVFPRTITRKVQSTDDLWVAHIDGTHQRQVMNTPRIDELTPDWQAT